MTRRITNILLLLTLFSGIVLSLVSCANPGSGPDGGPYDETPPYVVATRPLLGNANVKRGNRITIRFSEPVKVENAVENIVISPPQINPPEIKMLGKRIEVQLMDSLRDNTTYTIDFSDAVTDVTEGNPLGNFTYFFSTGADVDTMEMSGYVIDAHTLEPIKGMLVGVHSNLSDTAFLKIPLLRMGRTDGEGHFSIKGIAPGNYHVFALKDIDGNFCYTQGEEMAFDTTVLTPSSFPDVRYDTAWVDSIHYDTIRSIPYTHFTPDDILLRAFKPVRNICALTKIVRPEPTVFTAFFNAPNPSLPTLTGLNFNADSALIVSPSARADTITYWIRDSKVRSNDTLRFTYAYEKTNDSTEVLEHIVDTFELVPRVTNAFLREKAKRDSIKWVKKLKKLHKRGDFEHDTPPTTPLKLITFFQSSITPMQNLLFGTEQPILQLDTTGIHLQLKKDSLYIPAKYKLERRGLQQFVVKGAWRPGQEYRISIDSAKIVGLEGYKNFPLKRDIKIYQTSQLGALFVQMPDAPDSTIVQLLSGAKRVARQTLLIDHQADFFYLRPGKYFLRCIIDRNHNGRWDTGNYLEGLQPEEIYYLPQLIEVKANWDIKQEWHIHSRSLRENKPKQLRKSNNSKRRRTTGHERNLQRMKEKGIVPIDKQEK